MLCVSAFAVFADVETQFFFHLDYLDVTMDKTAPRRAGQVGYYIIGIANPNLVGEVSAAIDATFKKYPDEHPMALIGIMAMGVNSMKLLNQFGTERKCAHHRRQCIEHSGEFGAAKQHPHLCQRHLIGCRHPALVEGSFSAS